MEKYYGYCQSPLGVVEVIATKEHVLSVSFVDSEGPADKDIPLVMKAVGQLEEYFAGKRKSFELSFEFEGTDFQKKVWQELTRIPYGETISYKELAVRIGNEKACRAVGGANNKNKIAIMVPCHRVVGASGDMIGYAGGLDKKKWLLELERSR